MDIYRRFVSRDVFRIQSIIYDEAFLRKKLTVVCRNYFPKLLHHICLTGYYIYVWLAIHVWFIYVCMYACLMKTLKYMFDWTLLGCIKELYLIKQLALLSYMTHLTKQTKQQTSRIYRKSHLALKNTVCQFWINMNSISHVLKNKIVWKNRELF